MPWVREDQQVSQHTKGFSGFPASTMKVKGFQDQEQVFKSEEGHQRIVTKKTTIKEVHESSSSSVMQSSSSVTFKSSSGAVENAVSVGENADEAEEEVENEIEEYEEEEEGEDDVS